MCKLIIIYLYTIVNCSGRYTYQAHFLCVSQLGVALNHMSIGSVSSVTPPVLCSVAFYCLW